MLSNIFREEVVHLAAKRTMLRDNPNITTLVVGSSHGDYGFDPSEVEGSFNLCFRSQDLKHSYNLYRKISEECPSITTLVLFYSIFSPGSMIEKSPSSKEVSVVANEIFDLNLSYEDPSLAALYTAVRGKFDEIKISLEGHAGFMPRVGKPFIGSNDVEKRVADHMKLNGRKEALPYLGMILDLAHALGHRMIIVLSPARSDYRQHAGAGSDLFSDIGPIVRAQKGREVRIVDLYSFEGFDDRDFGDFDHLHPLGLGPKIMSRIIRDAVQRPNG
ncbi:MAG: hypothetical protein KGI75_24575 [Rhizobiaceae bacterium]|nr:hypothetical protein [Rhizobiaceae bacterium]